MNLINTFKMLLLLFVSLILPICNSLKTVDVHIDKNDEFTLLCPMLSSDINFHRYKFVRVEVDSQQKFVFSGISSLNETLLSNNVKSATISRYNHDIYCVYVVG